ncbi:MAG: chitobiase/beta-hexosaminidase C-terminal domain-containing protein [Verrucomicrobiae bacterium]|nr:chitobiase/beta-hexosaminidase C-terminal domain-containing protein [Verrucomicrobiae bacterium]
MKSVILLIAITAMIAGLGKLPAATTSELSQFGITWKFAKPVEFGKFVSGEYYVVDPGGGVVVSSVSPLPSGGRNGSMVNPVPSKDWVATNQTQGYDNRLPRFNEAVSISFPATLKAGSSLVSTVSLTPADLDSSGQRYTASWQSAYTPSSAHVKLKSAAVLTVLSSAPPAGTFRPPFVGNAKPLYNVSQIKRKYLRQLPAPGVAPSRPISYFERGLERPWINHGYWTEALYLHPTENMLHYHQYIGEFLSEASLIMLTSLSTDALEIGFIQRGIDMYYTVILGPADQAYFEWQVMYTGLLLGDQNMMNASKNGTPTPGRVAEKIYYWDGHKSTIKSKIVPEGQTWTGAKVFFRKQVGQYEYEHLHPSEWGQAVVNPSEPATNGGVKSEKYRQGQDSIPHMGMALTSRILGTTSLWRTRALDDYLTRWMTEDWTNKFKPVVDQNWSGVPNYTQSMGTPFNNEMWRLYKNYTLSDGTVEPPVLTAAAPTASPSPGLYVAGKDVVLSTTTPGGIIYYTIDGTTPSAASEMFSGKITVNKSTTIKAITVAANYTASPVFVADYVIDPDATASASSSGWINSGFLGQDGVFTAKFVLTPGSENMDGVFGLSGEPVEGNPAGYYKLVAAIRFAVSGRIEAYNGNTYQSDKVITYKKATPYVVEFVVNMETNTYDVRVDGALLADDYKFRNDLSEIEELNNFAGFASISDTFFTIKSQIRIPGRPEPADVQKK